MKSNQQSQGDFPQLPLAAQVAFPERLCSSGACSRAPYQPAAAAAADWEGPLQLLAPSAVLAPHLPTALEVVVPLHSLEVHPVPCKVVLAATNAHTAIPPLTQSIKQSVTLFPELFNASRPGA